MADLKTLSQELVQALHLPYEPVGVNLYREGDLLPPDLPLTNLSLKSFCQALTLAGKGQTLLLARENMGCKLGTSVLGMEDQDMERYLDDGVLEKYGVGLFATEEASAATIKDAIYLEKGKTKAVLVAPVSALSELPQVVVFTADSEQVMWLLYAVNYEKGGRINLPQSGGALGGCADITALPLLQGVPNITFLGLGCRIKAQVGPCHLMMGLPGRDLPQVAAHLREMAKPIAMLRTALGQGGA
ncbi:MAG: DUF169 domain-containing protein [Syntrophobacterales bacterium]|nr:DUF169 domain-containing protein [Syntrophobacterales bacterium]